MHADFWIAVGQIIMIDILLGGDNAVVIALACRKLPAKQRTQGILWGTAGAIILRVVLIFFALTLLAIPYLKIIGAILLIAFLTAVLIPFTGFLALFFLGGLYLVVNFLYRWLTIAQLSARLRCAECGGAVHSVKPWRLEEVLGKPKGRRG